jgi:hypothetical protein
VLGTYNDLVNGVVMGEFVEAEYGNFFHYRANTNEWALQFTNNAGKPLYPHEIYTLAGIRSCRVQRHSIVLVTDECAYGRPIEVKWDIKKHRKYKEGV